MTLGERWTDEAGATWLVIEHVVSEGRFWSAIAVRVPDGETVEGMGRTWRADGQPQRFLTGEVRAEGVA